MTTTSSKHILSVELATARPQATLGNTSVSARRSAMIPPESQSYDNDDFKALFLMESMTDNWNGQVK